MVSNAVSVDFTLDTGVSPSQKSNVASLGLPRITKEAFQKKAEDVTRLLRGFQSDYFAPEELDMTRMTDNLFAGKVRPVDGPDGNPVNPVDAFYARLSQIGEWAVQTRQISDLKNTPDYKRKLDEGDEAIVSANNKLVDDALLSTAKTLNQIAQNTTGCYLRTVDSNLANYNTSTKGIFDSAIEAMDGNRVDGPLKVAKPGHATDVNITTQTEHVKDWSFSGWMKWLFGH